MKAEELVTEPLFYNDNIQVRNNTVLHRRWIEKGVCRISQLLHEHEAFLCLEEFNMKYGLNTDFVTYNGCVQAVKKYIKVWILLSKVIAEVVCCKIDHFVLQVPHLVQ